MEIKVILVTNDKNLIVENLDNPEKLKIILKEKLINEIDINRPIELLMDEYNICLPLDIGGNILSADYEPIGRNFENFKIRIMSKKKFQKYTDDVRDVVIRSFEETKDPKIIINSTYWYMVDDDTKRDELKHALDVGVPDKKFFIELCIIDFPSV